MGQIIIRVYCTFFSLCVFSGFLLGQTQPLENNSLKEGMWAIQFGISSNFTLTTFEGSTFSLKYQLSDKNAVRCGITINGTSNNGTNLVSATYADTNLGSMPGNTSSKLQNIAFITQYLWYINSNSPVHFYVALGPNVSYNYTESSSDNVYNSNYLYDDRYSSSNKQWSAGVTGSAGVEWFPAQWFSLRAEYIDNLLYQWSSGSTTEDESSPHIGFVPGHYEKSSTSKGWTLSNSSVNFGLSVYW